MDSIIESVMASITESVKESTIEFRNPLFRVILQGCNIGVYRFYIGLDESTNKFHPDKYGPKHPLNPALNILHWSWQGGYIFLALEGHYRKKSKRSGYSCWSG